MGIFSFALFFFVGLFCFVVSSLVYSLARSLSHDGGFSFSFFFGSFLFSVPSRFLALISSPSLAFDGGRRKGFSGAHSPDDVIDLQLLLFLLCSFFSSFFSFISRKRWMDGVVRCWVPEIFVLCLFLGIGWNGNGNRNRMV
jgi:hypothetical protein